ncbi:MAG: CRISPR-associated endonuclease Cas1 [Sulfolobales archaeon]|nr:CRISPR-associated endonuclease Cas1 [Sulfolobales archaeon]MCX8186877.1 CRISPR-associated endonuclease Cas1 [Sulfolobales archaeon]MDW7970161.1 CRISPR-associated endonuclease Cas1 [Sulfolobales archaeon]
MKTLIISGYGVRVGTKHNYIVIKNKEGTKNVAPAEIERIVITTSGVTITSKFLRLATNYGIDVVVLDSRGFPVSRFYHPYITKTVDSRLAQYASYTNGLAKEVAKAIAYCKLMNQAGYVARLGKSLNMDELRSASRAIESLANEVLQIDDELHELRRKAMELEAHGARMYWSSIASTLPSDLRFEGRDQNGNDQVNMALNYGYSILYSECWKAIALSGLDPYCGFLHTERSGKPVLTFDLIEMFRVAAVDSTLIPKFRSGWRVEVLNDLISHNSRTEIIKTINEGLNKRFRSRQSSSYMTLTQWIRHVAQELANALREGRKPKGFIAKW